MLKRTLAGVSLAALLLSGGMALAQSTTSPAGEAPKPMVATSEVLEPEAAAALDSMGAALRAMQSFKVTSHATMETVYQNGQKLQFSQVTSYTVQKPDKMMVDIKTDNGHRRVFYDGKVMAITGDVIKKYVAFSVTGSISEVLAKAYENYGIDFPLQDLFRWGDPSAVAAPPSSGFLVGEAMVGDQKVNQYAFRQDGVDFQLWLKQGDQPLPLKMVITNTDVAAQPDYVAYFTWDTSPKIDASTFTFSPGKDYQLIDFGTAKATGVK